MHSIMCFFSVTVFLISSVVLNFFFLQENHNALLLSFTMAPGILPFIPLLVSKPIFMWRWVYIVLGLAIQLTLSRFDLMWGNLWVLLVGDIAVFLLYYAFLVNTNRSFVLKFFCGVFFGAFFLLLCQQLYVYNEITAFDVCFTSEEYCGSSCYKDYNEVSCKTGRLKSEIFHGNSGAYYRFSIEGGSEGVIFFDSEKSVKYILSKNALERRVDQ
ncbi:hypothetical protein ACY5GL_001877 [Cronobacter malonaticus]